MKKINTSSSSSPKTCSWISINASASKVNICNTVEKESQRAFGAAALPNAGLVTSNIVNICKLIQFEHGFSYLKFRDKKTVCKE